MKQTEITGGDDRAVDVHAAEVPPAVRQAVLKQMRHGDALWRCPRLAGKNGLFGLGQKKIMVEWWLISADGELVEVFWGK